MRPWNSWHEAIRRRRPLHSHPLLPIAGLALALVFFAVFAFACARSKTPQHRRLRRRPLRTSNASSLPLAAAAPGAGTQLQPEPRAASTPMHACRTCSPITSILACRRSSVSCRRIRQQFYRGILANRSNDLKTVGRITGAACGPGDGQRRTSLTKSCSAWRWPRTTCALATGQKPRRPIRRSTPGCTQAQLRRAGRDRDAAQDAAAGQGQSADDGRSLRSFRLQVSTIRSA